MEPIEPEGLEILAPPPLQRSLQVPEMIRLGFGSELPEQAQRVSLESDWMERLSNLLDDKGRWTQRILTCENPPPGSPERILQHGLELLNATYRLRDVNPAWTRYLILSFRYTALSDEKRDGILNLGFNLATQATLDGLLEALWAEADVHENTVEESAIPSDVQLPAPWQRSRLNTILQRALPARVHHRLEPFFKSMHRRQARDLERLYDYHNDLRREARERLAALPASAQLSDKQQTDKQRENLRLEAITREYQAKVNDLRQKYAMNVELEWIQTLQLIIPVQRFEVLIKRRKGERVINLDWNPLVRKLEQAPCEYSYTWERPREVCDAALHLVSPVAHGPCAHCDKPYCRACHPKACPRCGR